MESGATSLRMPVRLLSRLYRKARRPSAHCKGFGSESKGLGFRVREEDQTWQEEEPCMEQSIKLRIEELKAD